jgi:hypothetical protein
MERRDELYEGEKGKNGICREKAGYPGGKVDDQNLEMWAKRLGGLGGVNHLR